VIAETATDMPVTDLDLEAFTRRYMAAWNACGTAALAELVSEDVVWADPALAEPARGLAAVQDFMRASFRSFPDLRFSEPPRPHLSVAGSRVAWAWRMEGTMNGYIDPPGFAPTGESFAVEGVDLWEMDGGRIADYRAFYDINDLVRQLGILPAAGSRAESASVALQRLQVRLGKR
jgi:steroid delta-isomerase-like uncharacterized protein